MRDFAERSARIHQALSNLERFFAGTIHSFCGRLLRERPVEAGVSPGFIELDETEDALLRKQSWRDFLTASKAAGDPAVLELLEAGIKPKELDEAFETVCLYEDVDFPPGDAPRPDTATGFQALDRFWSELCRMLPAHYCARDDMQDAENSPQLQKADEDGGGAPGKTRHAGRLARNLGLHPQDRPKMVG